MDITGTISSDTINQSGAFYGSYETIWAENQTGGSSDYKVYFQASRTWEGSTSNASPITSISKTGDGKAFDILPSYYTCHMWLRLT